MVTNTKIMSECPSCGETVIFERKPTLGQFIDCPFCEEFLEVIDLDPLLLDWPIEDGDYDDDEDDFYEDDD